MARPRDGSSIKPASDGLLPSYFAAPSVLVSVGALLFYAAWTGAASVVLLCLLVLGTALVTEAWRLVALARLRARVRVKATRVFAGDAVELSVRVVNAKVLPVWLRVRVRMAPGAFGTTAALSQSSEPTIVARAVSLSSYRQAELSWSLTARRRGVLRLGPISLEAGDVLGFQRSERDLGVREVLVYPRLVPLRPPALARRELYGRPGRSPANDMAYVQGLSDYRPGAPARAIDWKASARLRKLVERVGQPSAQHRVLIVVCVDGFAGRAGGFAGRADGFDGRGPVVQGDDDPFEVCLQVAASLAVDLSRRGRAVGLVTNGALWGDGGWSSPVARGPEALARLLEITARLTAVPEAGIRERIQQSRALSTTTTLVCFGHDHDETARSLQAWLAHRGVSARHVSWLGPRTGWNGERLADWFAQAPGVGPGAAAEPVASPLLAAERAP